MVNFRYHLVTISAIFLALAAGIVLGVTVGDKASPVIEAQLKAAKENRATADRFAGDNKAWRDFGAEASSSLLAGRLTDVPVLLVGVRGVDSQRAKDVREHLTNADARYLGTIWLTGKLTLERSEDVATLAALLELPALGAAEIRAVALKRLAQQLASPDRPRPVSPIETAVPTTLQPGATTTSSTVGAASTTSTTSARASRVTLLAGLANAGFVDLDPPAAGTLDPQVLLPAETRFVVLSAEDVDVANDVAAIPFLQALVEASGAFQRTVAVEPGRAPTNNDPGVRNAFIGPLRASSKDVDSAVSTVNDIEDFRGLAAMVLALADLERLRVGHYGLGEGVDRLVPEAVAG